MVGSASPESPAQFTSTIRSMPGNGLMSGLPAPEIIPPGPRTTGAVAHRTVSHSLRGPDVGLRAAWTFGWTAIPALEPLLDHRSAHQEVMADETDGEDDRGCDHILMFASTDHSWRSRYEHCEWQMHQVDPEGGFGDVGESAIGLVNQLGQPEHAEDHQPVRAHAIQ